jgi:hypothetical protein
MFFQLFLFQDARSRKSDLSRDFHAGNGTAPLNGAPAVAKGGGATSMVAAAIAAAAVIDLAADVVPLIENGFVVSLEASLDAVYEERRKSEQSI